MFLSECVQPGIYCSRAGSFRKPNKQLLVACGRAPTVPIELFAKPLAVNEGCERNKFFKSEIGAALFIQILHHACNLSNNGIIIGNGTAQDLVIRHVWEI